MAWLFQSRREDARARVAGGATLTLEASTRRAASVEAKKNRPNGIATGRLTGIDPGHPGVQKTEFVGSAVARVLTPASTKGHVDRQSVVDEADERSGLVKWLTSTDHKVIGLSYLVTSITMFFFAGAMALVIRLQLTTPHNSLLKLSAI